MKEKIEHAGIVDSVVGEHVIVKIVQHAACNGCKARSMCSSSESKEKMIDVYEPGADGKYRIGDTVRVCGALSMGKQAVVLAFGIPLAIMVVWMMLALIFLKMTELLSAGVLAAILAIYFFALYCNKDKMARKFAFWIEKS
ncbi:MAG: SoxR reducing system RseC family protein [Prevotellaceae bacterium]|nr:SoxR reducing system RseC family protein [Candidatus Minthosoma caballi]